MKPFFYAVTACLLLAAGLAAQQVATDTPATKEDVERYLEITHARDTTKQMMEVIRKQTHDMMRAKLSKQALKLPPDFEARMDKMMDDMLKDFPVEEMLQAMVPVYQKHWTKGDVEAMIAFYSSPTGQKILKELPATMAEAMQAMAPIVQKQMDRIMERVQQEVAQVLKDSTPKPERKPQVTRN